MSYVVDGGQIRVGLNWDRSGSRVLTTNIFVKFFQKNIIRKEIVRERCNYCSENILPVADQWQEQAGLRRAPTGGERLIF